jgi:hypothetical protein
MYNLLITEAAIETGLELAEAKAHAAEVEAAVGGFDPLAAMLGMQPAELTEALEAVHKAQAAHDEAVKAQAAEYKVIDGVMTKYKGCTRCAGKGVIPAYNHYSGGKCFGCNGSGTRAA